MGDIVTDKPWNRQNYCQASFLWKKYLSKAEFGSYEPNGSYEENFSPDLCMGFLVKYSRMIFSSYSHSPVISDIRAFAHFLHFARKQTSWQQNKKSILYKNKTMVTTKFLYKINVYRIVYEIYHKIWTLWIFRGILF